MLVGSGTQDQDGLLLSTTTTSSSLAESASPQLIEFLTEISAAAVEHPDSDSFFKLLADRALALLHAETVGISIVSADRRSRTYKAVAGKHAGPLAGRRLPVYHGPCGRVIRTGQPLIITAIEANEADTDLVNHIFKAKNVAAAPIRWRSKIWGVLAAYNKVGEQAFTSGELMSATILANFASTAMENSRLLENNKRYGRQLDSLYRVGLLAGESFDVDQSLRTILHVAQAAITFDEASFLLYDGLNLSRVITAQDVSEIEMSEIVAPLSWSIADSCVATNQTILIGDTSRDQRCQAIDDLKVSASVAAIPLRAGARILGVLLLASHAVHAFPRDEIWIATMVAKYAAEAIERTRLLAEAGRASGALQVDKKKTEWVATVSHEIRTPIACIKSVVETLLREDIALEPDEQGKFLGTIGNMCDRLTKIAEELLLLSKFQAGHVALASSPLELRPKVEQSVQVFRLRDCRHSFVIDIDPHIPTVWADPVRLDAVLENLISNAVKYSPYGGTITIGADVYEKSRTIRAKHNSKTSDHKSATFLKVSVSDHGIGIPSDALDSIFEPFFQVETVASKRREGVGFGLYICRGYIEAMGGKIWAQSELGRGTTISFILPLHSSQPAAGNPIFNKALKPI